MNSEKAAIKKRIKELEEKLKKMEVEQFIKAGKLVKQWAKTGGNSPGEIEDLRGQIVKIFEGGNDEHSTGKKDKKG